MNLAATTTRFSGLCRLLSRYTGVWVLRGLLIACACIVLMSQNVAAKDERVPNLDTWVSYKAPDHGYTLKAPPDWELSSPDPSWSETIILLHHPSYEADCGLEYTPAKPGVEVNMEVILEYMTDERVVEVASREFSSVTLHEKKAIKVSGRKGLLSVFSGTRDAQWLTVMTITTVRANKVYRLQCFARPENVDEIFLVFLGMGKSLEIRPD